MGCVADGVGGLRGSVGRDGGGGGFWLVAAGETVREGGEEEAEEDGEEEETAAAFGGEGGADAGAENEMPYYWTDSLSGEDFRGAGIYADVTLRFIGNRISVFINGRAFGEVEFSADNNAEEDDRIVRTDGMFCRDGWIRDLRFRDGYQRDSVLSAELICADGTARTVVFHTRSEECLYIDTESGKAVFAPPV